MYENDIKQAEVVRRILKEILEYLIRIVLVGLGTGGIIQIIISCSLTNVESRGIIIFAFTLSAIYVLIMYSDVLPLYTYVIPLGVMSLFGIIKYKLVLDGVAGIINDVLKVAKYTYNIDYESILIGGYDGNVYNNSRIAALMVFSGIIAFFVSICVVHVHNMIGAIFTILPFIVLFGVFNIMPDTTAIVMCAMFIFGVMTVNRKGTFAQTTIVMLACGLVAYLCVSLIPEESFERAEVFNKYNTVAQKSLDNIMDSGIFGNVVANGGINNGKLGKVDKIEYSGDKLLTVTTANTGKSQYFPDFVGRNYVNNSWTDDNIDEQANITDDIIKFMEKYEGIRNYIAGENGDFYKIVDKYKYTLSYENTDKIRAGSIYDINVDSFGVFSDIFSEDNDLSSLIYYKYDINRKDLSVYNPYNIIKAKEQIYKRDVYTQYLDVPEDVKQIIVDILGDVKCTTTEQKEAYINKVRDYLEENYEYTTSPGKVPLGKDFITYFLTDSKKGYCTYFASAGVMMLRSAGIPARYVEGYALTAEQIAKGVVGNGQIERFVDETNQDIFEYSTRTLPVTDRAAHAWVEAYIDGFGWVTVEVTPGSATFGVSSLNLSQAIVQKNENAQNAIENEVVKEDNNTSNTEAETESVAQDNQQQTESISENTNEQEQSLNKTGIDKLLSIIDTKIFVVLMIMLGVIIVIMIILLVKLINKKKLQKYIDNADVLSMYMYLEKVLAKSGLQRQNNMDYMEFARVLDESNEVCHRHNIIKIMNCVLKNRFAGNQNFSDKNIKNENMENIIAMKAIIDEIK